jgi:hypothetical protein
MQVNQDSNASLAPEHFTDQGLTHGGSDQVNERKGVTQ